MFIPIILSKFVASGLCEQSKRYKIFTNPQTIIEVLRPLVAAIEIATADMEKGMKAVQSARTKLAHYPKAIAMCSAEASEYAKCVVAKENLTKDDCVQEFQRFNKCFKQAMKTLK